MTEDGKKPPRKPIPPDIQAEVLTKSRRRCTLCFYLDGNLEEKKGQIVHIDDNPSNFKMDNLAWMCLEHHSVFDSTNSQHKNYTQEEVKIARGWLYDAIAAEKHLTYKKGDPKPQPGLAADTKTLDALISLMASTGTIDWLRENNFAGFPFAWNRLKGLAVWTEQKGPEYEFIDAELEATRKSFHAAATKFLWTLATETFSGGNGHSSVPQEWEIEQPERFDRVVREIHDGASLVCTSYDELVRQARGKLSA